MSSIVLSVAFLIQVVPSFLVMSSCHLLLGRPFDLFPLLGCHSVQCLVHLLSFIFVICPAHLHFCFSVYSMMSIIFNLYLISEHGILSCSYRSYIFLSIALWAVLCLSIVYWETMFCSHRSLLARHIDQLLVMISKDKFICGVRIIPISGSKSYQWLKNWHSSGYPAMCLALQDQLWDWLALCQYTVTG